MFKRVYSWLSRITTDIADLQSDVDEVYDVTHSIKDKVSSMETWMELLTDTKADEVSAEFEKLLDAHIAAKQKMTNKALVTLVHQAVINTAK